MIPALSAAGALFGTSPLAQATPAADLAAKAAAVAGDGFGQILDEIGAAINSLKGGEAAALSGLHGRTPVQDVVESVMNAEHSLQTAVAIRDKLVSAYQTISQMAI